MSGEVQYEYLWLVACAENYPGVAMVSCARRAVPATAHLWSSSGRILGAADLTTSGTMLASLVP